MEGIDHRARSRRRRRITIVGKVDPTRDLVKLCSVERNPCLVLLKSLQRCASGKVEDSIDEKILEIARNKDLPWVVTDTYSRLLRKDGGPPDGTVFTPPWLAEEVVGRLKPGLPVIDLGAGSGMLTLTAAQKGFSVVAVEEDQELAMVLDSLARIMGLRSKIDLRVGDALSFSRRGEAQIMSNPPFTRHHSIPARKKRELVNLASNFDLPLQLTTGYYGYFMAYAWASKWSKRDVLLLPTNWLEAKYGHALKQLLLRREYEISIVENGYHTPVFDHALTTVCLLTSQPRANRDSKVPQPSENPGHHSNGVDVRLITPVDVLNGPNGNSGRKDSKEGHLARLLIPKLANPPNGVKNDRPILGDIFKVRRGAATGNNAFFIVSRSQARELGIERQELVRILRRLRSDTLSKDTAYLWSPAQNPSEASLRRIKAGEDLGVNRGYLCTHRKPWWRVEHHGPPPFFISYMGRGKPLIVENRNRLLNLNNVHGLYVKEKISIEIARRIAMWLSSKGGAEAILGQARHYYGGLWKLEPHDVEQTPLPARLGQH